MFRRTIRKGFLSIEFIIVMVAIILVLSVAAFKGSEMINMGKSAQANTSTAFMGSLCSEYKVEIGQYPNSLNDLTKKNGNYGPWILSIDKDPWGNSYLYKKSNDGFVVYSMGANKKDDGSSINRVASGDIGFCGK